MEEGETPEGSLGYSRKFAGIDFSLILTFRVRDMALEMCKWISQCLLVVAESNREGKY